MHDPLRRQAGSTFFQRLNSLICKSRRARDAGGRTTVDFPPRCRLLRRATVAACALLLHRTRESRMAASGLRTLFVLPDRVAGKGRVRYAWNGAGTHLAVAGRGGTNDVVHMYDRHGGLICDVLLEGSAPCLSLEWDKDGEVRGRACQPAREHAREHMRGEGGHARVAAARTRGGDAPPSPPSPCCSASSFCARAWTASLFGTCPAALSCTSTLA